MQNKKSLSNPFSTGGGGVHFEAHVQASFVALMLTGGYAPCLPCWPIKEVKLQGKVEGFETDDLIIVVENVSKNECRKLLVQIKHSITITPSSSKFGEVIQAAWDDFNNPALFTCGKDIIALITGPLTQTDSEITWLLNHARANPNDPQRFFRNIATANFSSNVKRQKLNVIRDHLKAANKNNDLTDECFHKFLKSFYLLGYDLGEEEGVILSLINSHISQFKPESSRYVWSRIMEFTNNRNHHAGCITQNDLPDDLTAIFVFKHINAFPISLTHPRVENTNWSHHPDATYLVLAVLLGSWENKNKFDSEVITELLGISYDDWLHKAREILHFPDSPFSLKNGRWKVVNRVELWNLLGSRILDQNLDTFRLIAGLVLKESDPAFDVPTDERHIVRIHSKVLKYSHMLRKGIAEGLAILSSHPKSCINCSQGKVESICVLVIRELLFNADWILWGSLNSLLPILAEAAPNQFLDAIEKAMRLSPSPFDELFSQEGSGITGSNYLTGLLWALEGLAWDEQYLVRVCAALAELASHDPGGQWSNRPSNSLATILLPWLPQTLATLEKRKVAVRTILKEWPDIGWNLILRLLPGQHQISSGSHKPSWHLVIPDDWGKGISNEEYWQQISDYGELAVVSAGLDITRLTALIDHLDNLPEPTFESLLEVLASKPISELPEKQRISIWNHLRKFTNKHRRFSDAKWALPHAMILRIEQVAEQLAPINPFNLYQHLFIDRDFDLYEENSDWREQGKKLEIRRENAISVIFRQHGFEGVVLFAETVSSPRQVGHALGVITDPVIEQTLLPNFLDSSDNKHKSLVSSFLWRRFHLKGWGWCDDLNKSGWTPEQVGQFLAYLPFTKETWDRASEWLQAHESEYWTRTDANPYQVNSDVTIAIEKLIDHSRPYAAINCLDMLRHNKQPIDSNQCIRALIAALNSDEPSYVIDEYHLLELIKFLQTEPSVNEDDLFKVEWAYVALLNRNEDASPQLLESKLANDPEFFCQVISLIYSSKKESQQLKEPTEASKAIAINAWQLLHEWRTPPGTQKDGTFNEDQFTEWLKRVKEISTESGHLEVALINIGEVLIHTSPDPDGLFIHKIVASALNERLDDEMRAGFRTGIYNSRGVHWVDPSGKQERELANQFRRKAEEIENAGFQRFAKILKELAQEYDREAEQVILDHQQRFGE